MCPPSYRYTCTKNSRTISRRRWCQWLLLPLSCQALCYKVTSDYDCEDWKKKCNSIRLFYISGLNCISWYSRLSWCQLVATILCCGYFYQTYSRIRKLPRMHHLIFLDRYILYGLIGISLWLIRGCNWFWSHHRSTIGINNIWILRLCPFLLHPGHHIPARLFIKYYLHTK